MNLINFSGITKRENEPPIGMFIIKMRLIALLTPGRPLNVGYVVNDFELQVPKLRTKPNKKAGMTLQYPLWRLEGAVASAALKQGKPKPLNVAFPVTYGFSNSDHQFSLVPH